MIVGDFSLVSGEVGASCGALSWRLSFFDEGAFSSHLIFIGISREGDCSFTVESGVVVVVMVAVSDGRRIGTNADLTTSIGSSSESSDDECDE